MTDIFPDKNRRCIPQLRTQLLSRLIIIMKIPLFRLLQPSPTISSVQAKEVWGIYRAFRLALCRSSSRSLSVSWDQVSGAELGGLGTPRGRGSGRMAAGRELERRVEVEGVGKEVLMGESVRSVAMVDLAREGIDGPAPGERVIRAIRGLKVAGAYVNVRRGAL